MNENDEPKAPKPQPVLYPNLGGLLGEWEQDAAAAYQARQSGEARGPITRLEGLDRELGGAFSPGVHVIHGQPGAGKSAVALQIAADCGCPALYLTCEMRALELMRRVTARITSVYLGRLKSGELHPDQSLEYARQAAAQVPRLAICDATTIHADSGYLQSISNAVRGDSRNFLLVVDSVHSWAESAPGDQQEYDALNAGLATLRGLSAVLECPVLAVAERNRASMKAGGQSAGAGSRKIEYGSETVLELAREGMDKDGNYPPPDVHGEVPVTLKLSKNRNGAPGKKIKLAFHGALQRFREDGFN